MSRIAKPESDRGDAGAAAVEFALVAFVLIALLIGIIQFGYTFFEYVSVAHAAREGVRWAALGAVSEVDARAKAAAPGLDPSLLVITTGPGSSTDSVRVTATYPVTMFFPGWESLSLPTSISSVAEQREE